MGNINNYLKRYFNIKNLLQIGSIIIIMMFLFSCLQIQEKNKKVNNKSRAVGNFTVTTDGIEGIDYSYEVDENTNIGELKILTDINITIEGASFNDRIVVAKNVDAHITLKNVIVVLEEYAPLEIEEGSTGNVTITIPDESMSMLICSGNDNAAIEKNGEYISEEQGKLIIKCSRAGEDGHICDDNCGTLSATGGKNAAGIGGGNNGAGSNITISGGSYFFKSLFL